MKENTNFLNIFKKYYINNINCVSFITRRKTSIIFTYLRGESVKYVLAIIFSTEVNRTLMKIKKESKVLYIYICQRKGV